MRAVSLPVRLLVAASLAAVTALAAKPPEFPQATRVHGKVPVNLSGAWFLYAQAQFPGDKTRALQPELWTVSQKGERDVAFRLLDVELPKSIDEPERAGFGPRGQAVHGLCGRRSGGADPDHLRRTVLALPAGEGERGSGAASDEPAPQAEGAQVKRLLLVFGTIVAGGAPALATDLPGKGPSSTECFAILRTLGGTDATAPNRLECTDGDPGCDHDGDCHNGSCTFRVQVCINQDVAGCQAPAALRSLKIGPPKLGIPPPAGLSGELCGGLLPLGGPRRGKKKTQPGKRPVTLKAKPEGGKGIDSPKDTPA